MSDRVLRSSTRRVESDEFEEELEQEQALAEQLSTSWGDTTDIQEQAEAVQGTTGVTDDEQEGKQQESLDSDSLSSQASSSSGTSFDTPVSTSSTNENPKMPTVKIGGEEITLAATANTVSEKRLPLYDKRQRELLSEEKKIELFNKATKQVLSKQDLIDLMSPSFSDEDALQDTLEISYKITRIQEHLIDYDADGVFNIVKPEEQDPVKIADKQNDLFEDYMILTPKAVGKSNRWYNTYVDLQDQPWIPENLRISEQLLANNMSNSLWQAIQQEYHSYPVAEQGGPLLFIIMMKEIQKNNDICLRNLAKRAETLDISKIPGEDVSKVVNLLSGALLRLRAATKYMTPEGETVCRYVPEDFQHALLKLFQTASDCVCREIQRSVQASGGRVSARKEHA